ncbi:MAG: hypothetical protein P4L69_19245 [Desulfosporosinus sp.]|nr:hypothetical protein [Desulfosporosinus sp.]
MRLFSISDCDYVASVYRDPKSAVNHVICRTNILGKFWHIAVSDVGTVLSSTLFNNAGYTWVATIQGAGDGKHLFLAMESSSGIYSYSIHYTESSDEGATWDVPRIVKVDDNKYIEDLLYVKEYGRVYAFFINGDRELRVLTKAAGSVSFSEDIFIARNAVFNLLKAKAAYSIRQNALLLIHAFYVTTDGNLAYTQSATHGATWTQPKIIDDSTFEITHAVSSKFSESIYVSYSAVSSHPAKMIMTKDSGTTFSDPKSFTNKGVVLGNHGLAFCGSADNLLLVSYATDGRIIEYDFWKFEELAPVERFHPFSSSRTLSAGVGCNVDANYPAFKVAVFITQQDGLYFASEYGIFQTGDTSAAEK